jgi:hypothetical protein
MLRRHGFEPEIPARTDTPAPVPAGPV